MLARILSATGSVRPGWEVVALIVSSFSVIVREL
jgi:hypothetical protein